MGIDKVSLATPCNSVEVLLWLRARGIWIVGTDCYDTAAEYQMNVSPTRLTIMGSLTKSSPHGAQSSNIRIRLVLVSRFVSLCEFWQSRMYKCFGMSETTSQLHSQERLLRSAYLEYLLERV